MVPILATLSIHGKHQRVFLSAGTLDGAPVIRVHKLASEARDPSADLLALAIWTEADVRERARLTPEQLEIAQRNAEWLAGG